MTAKLCFAVGVVMLSCAAHADTDPSMVADTGPSMVCGKPSIREALQMDAKDVSAQTWQTVQTTAVAQSEEMDKTVVKLQDELTALDEKVEVKKNEKALSLLTESESKALIESAFDAEGDKLKTFAGAAQAKDLDCGYGEAAEEDVDYDTFLENSIQILKKKADATLRGKESRKFSRTVFEKQCFALIGEADTICGTWCDEFTNAVSEIAEKATSTAVLGGPTYDELVKLAANKRKELDTAQEVKAECSKSIVTINQLVAQFTEASSTLKQQQVTCGRVKRALKGQEIRLKKVEKEFLKAAVEDKMAQHALTSALADEAIKKEDKQKAADVVKLWREHVDRTKTMVEEQKSQVAETMKALNVASAASAAVNEFKDKLATALLGLVTYYDLAVRQPLAKMGIREELNIETLFPKPADTAAAENLRNSLKATKTFCAQKRGDFEKLPEIKASGDIHLTAICDSQDWDLVSAEVEAVVSAKRVRAIANLETAQKKVVAHSGPVADKDAGEVQGVWKAMALFGGTVFSKEYLSGWRFEKTDEVKGSKAGFMMDLALALKNSLKIAEDKWQAAKDRLTELITELEQFKVILETAEEFLQQKTKDYNVAVENTAEKQLKAKQAHEALEAVAVRKKVLEAVIISLTEDRRREEGLFNEATAALRETHKSAMGSFMELLHASEQPAGESWD